MRVAESERQEEAVALCYTSESRDSLTMSTFSSTR